MSSVLLRGETPRLRLLVGAVILLGAGSIASAALHAPGEVAVAGWALALVLAAFMVGDVPVLHIRFGRQQHSFTFSEAAVVLGMVLLPSPWLRIIAPAGVLLAQLAARRPPVKVAFNAASFAVGVILARIAYGLVADVPASHPVDPITWLGLAAGALVFFLWNGLTVAAAVAFSQNLRVRDVFGKGFLLNLIVFVGNTAAAIGLVALGAAQPYALFLVPIVAGLLLWGYRGYLRALEERDLWEHLQASSQTLLLARPAELPDAVLDRSARLFDTTVLDLLVADKDTALLWQPGGDEGARRTAGHADDIAATWWPRARSEREIFEVRVADAPEVLRSELRARGLVRAVVVPLLGPSGCIGALRVGFERPGRLRARDRQVMTTFASQISSAVRNVRLFEQAVAEGEKLRRIVDHSSDGIFAVDEEGRVRSWNPAMERATGCLAEEVLGAPLGEALLARDEDGRAVSTSWLADAAGRTAPAMVELTAESAEARWLSLSASAVDDPDSVHALTVVVARDVTAVRELEIAQHDFVSTVSHELRTPLTPIKGFLLTLLQSGDQLDADKVKHVHQRMLEQTNRLERLICDLLTISQLERGAFSVKEDVIALDELVPRVCADVSPDATVSVADGTVSALGDGDRVHQVLANLLSNAARYAPGSPVEVTVERDGRGVVVSVRDEGPGIPLRDHEAIFDRFRRLGDPLTRPSGGTGIGLYIARCLVEAMGGRIWVESEPDVGACFRFTLPAAPAGAGARPAGTMRLVAVS